MSQQSGQQIAQTNILKFRAWIADRRAAKDWHDYIRGGKLNRSEIAAECDFALSVLRQNPTVKDSLQDLEAELENLGILPIQKGAAKASCEAAMASEAVVEKKILAVNSKAEARNKELEEKNAALCSEVSDLRNRLRAYEYLDKHLVSTGKLIRL
jgi:hypothetical protein